MYNPIIGYGAAVVCLLVCGAVISVINDFRRTSHTHEENMTEIEYDLKKTVIREKTKLQLGKAVGVCYYKNNVVVEEIEEDEETVEEAVKRWEEELRAEGYDEETMSRIIDIKLGTLRHHYNVKTKREERKAKRERDEIFSAIGVALRHFMVY